MITYNRADVRISGGDHRLREAVIAWPDGRVRLVGLHQLKGTRGGVMEVTVAWEVACKRTEALEREQAVARDK
jgi:hypothetical protein